MTHSKEAVEAVARALAEEYFDGRRDINNPYYWASRDELHKAGWKLSALALLDRIAPMIVAQAVAAEREACNEELRLAVAAVREECARVADAIRSQGVGE